MNFHLCILNQLSTIFTVNPFELLACVGCFMLFHVLGRVEDLATVGAGVLLPKLAKERIKSQMDFVKVSPYGPCFCVFSS